MERAFRIDKSDVTNSNQARQAAEVVWILIRDGFSGSVTRFLFAMLGPMGMMRPAKIDARTKTGKAYLEAEEALCKAAERYDAALRAYKQFS